MDKIIISLFLTGLLFGSGPCLASCGPFLITYIAATKKDISQGMIVYILFSSARIFVYLVLALLIFFFSQFVIGKLLGHLSRYLLIFSGGMMVLIGFFLAFGRRLKFNFWQAWHKHIVQQDKKSVIVLGLIIGFLPCAPLLAILAYIGLISRNWLASLLYSLAFGIGTFLSPLILLIILAGLIPRFLLEKKVIYDSVFSFICGLIIILLGVQLISRAF